MKIILKIWIKDIINYWFILIKWVNIKFFNFSEINNNEIIKRTNNMCEFFHRYLNNTIRHFHPKLSYLLIELKETIYI